MDMERKERWNCWKQWLKRSYRSTPTEGPEAKRVKFSDIQDALTQQFPSDELSVQCCATVISETFPETKRVRVGKTKLSYVVGLEETLVTPGSLQMETLESTATDTIRAENTQFRAENAQLRAEVQQLQERIKDLEAEKLASTQCASSPLLMQQMDKLLHYGDKIIHGPSSPSRFSDFSLKAISEEIQSNAPDVYKLFMGLGDTDRNPTESRTPVEQRKTIMSLCTILNARRRTANGLQLLLSFMLLARATSKQVHIH